MATWKKVIVSGSAVSQLSFAGTGILSGSGAVTAVTDTATIDLTLSAGSISGVVASGSIDQGQLAAGAVIASKIADNAVVSSKIAAGAVITAALATGSVASANIIDGNVTNAKLANSSVTIGSTAVSLGSSATTISGLSSVTSTTFVGALTGNASTATSASYANLTNVSGDITITAPGVATIANNAITSAKIGAGQIVNAAVAAAAAIEYTKISFAGSGILSGSGAITGVTDSATIDLTNTAGTLSAVVISGSIDSGQLANLGVTTAKIDNDAVTSGKIAAGAVVTAKIADANVTDVKIASSSIQNGHIVNGTIANAKLANSAITIAGTSTSLGGSITAATILNGTGVVSASAVTSPSQGTLTVNGTNIDLGVQTGDSPTFAALTITGDLTVNGTTTTINTSNLVVEDRFVFLNAGSGSVVPAGEGGIIVESGSAGIGTAFYYDFLDQRWAVANGVASTATSVTADAFMTTAYVSVANGFAASTAATAAGYDDEGNIAISADGDIFIYS
jgi:hypothetical protein